MYYQVTIFEMDSNFSNSLRAFESGRIKSLSDAKREFKKQCQTNWSKLLKNYYIAIDKFNDFGYIGNITMKEFRAN